MLEAAAQGLGVAFKRGAKLRDRTDDRLDLLKDEDATRPVQWMSERKRR